MTDPRYRGAPDSYWQPPEDEDDELDTETDWEPPDEDEGDYDGATGWPEYYQ